MLNREGVGGGTWCGMGAPPSSLKGVGEVVIGGAMVWCARPPGGRGDLSVCGPLVRGAGHCDPVQGGGGGGVLDTSS